MKKYFYLKNGHQIGPFSYDQLWQQKISPETMVWCEGMPQWQKAKSVHEFTNWFPNQAAAQKRQPQQTQKRPQQNISNRQPVRGRQNQVAKPKKSYRGIIGVALFLVGIAIIYILASQAMNDSVDESNQDLETNEKSSSSSPKGKQQKVDAVFPAFGTNDNFTKENYPLHPQQMGEHISDFLGTARKSFSEAKLLYMHPDAEEKFQYIIDTYSEIAIKIFLQGPIPVIKYQSLTSALVLFYNPWNDLVMITDWQLVEGQLFMHDVELVTADFLEYDGLNIPEADPLWARTPDVLPIEALTNSMKQREELFDKLWKTQTGTGNWRKVLTSLLSPVSLVKNQAAVAYRLRDHYAGMQYLIIGKDMAVLRNPFIRDMKKLHSKNTLPNLLNAGSQTPDIVRENFTIYPTEIWTNASLQVVRKVPEGAFVFVTTPKLTKTFLSFYYKFGTENELILNRIDWCTFDNEL